MITKYKSPKYKHTRHGAHQLKLKLPKEDSGHKKYLKLDNTD